MFGVLKCIVAASVRYKCAARLLGSRLRRLSLHVQTEVSLRSADQDRCSSVCSARPKTGFDLKCQTEAWHQSYRVDRGTRAEGQFSGANASKASVRRSGPIRLTAASVLLRKPNRAVCISPFAVPAYLRFRSCGSNHVGGATFMLLITYAMHVIRCQTLAPLHSSAP